MSHLAQGGLVHSLRRSGLNDMASLHPAAPHHLPSFIAAPGEADTLMVMISIFLVISLVVAGVLFLRLHTLPERMAHRGQKLQFEIVAVLGLLALFTHIHLFWVAALLLAMIDLPDFGGPLTRMARSLERLADRSASAEAQSSDTAAAPIAAAITEPPRDPVVVAPMPKPGDTAAQPESQAEMARA